MQRMELELKMVQLGLVQSFSKNKRPDRSDYIQKRPNCLTDDITTSLSLTLKDFVTYLRNIRLLNIYISSKKKMHSNSYLFNILI